MKSELLDLACALLLAAVMTGCAPYTDAQVALIDQAHKGVSLARDAQTEHAQLVDQLHALQRRRLDEAFNRDARETPELSAEWVIEARKAYAVGVDGLHAQRDAANEAHRASARNLDATDAALAHLRHLVTIPRTSILGEDGK